MLRTTSLAAVIAVAFALPVGAADTTKVEPGTGPTESMSSQVPAMKDTGSSSSSTEPGKAMNSATPVMKPGDSASPTVTTGIVLSDKEAKDWIGKPVYSSDNKKIGDVENVKRGTNGQVIELHAGIGGFLGLGETHVRIVPLQFNLQKDRVTLNVLSADAKGLPRVE
jgi:hypothetical protein